MGYISVSGITFAVPIAALAALAVAADARETESSAIRIATPVTTSGADLAVSVSGLRSDQGLLRYCVAPAGAVFPQCSGTGAISGSEAISRQAAAFVVRGLIPGNYAVAVYHDQNRSNRLDTFIGIPREGYGFSRNPPFKPRAPRFDEAAFNLTASTNIEIRMRYLF